MNREQTRCGLQRSVNCCNPLHYPLASNDVIATVFSFLHLSETHLQAVGKSHDSACTPVHVVVVFVPELFGRCFGVSCRRFVRLSFLYAIIRAGFSRSAEIFILRPFFSFCKFFSYL